MSRLFLSFQSLTQPYTGAATIVFIYEDDTSLLQGALKFPDSLGVA
jgi:hypothetical protein